MYAFPPEKKCTSCPRCSSSFPSAMVREACPKPSSEQAYSSLISHTLPCGFILIIPIAGRKRSWWLIFEGSVLSVNAKIRSYVCSSQNLGRKTDEASC